MQIIQIVSQMSNKEFNSFNTQKAGKLIEKVLTANQLQSIIFYNKIIQHWEVIVGIPLAAKTSPAKLYKKSLTVLVEDAAYAQHLRYFENKILELISSPEICGENKVLKIIFRVGKIKPREQIERIVQPHPLPKNQITEKSLKTADKCAEKIQDKVLKQSFARLMAKSLDKK